MKQRTPEDEQEHQDFMRDCSALTTRFEEVLGDACPQTITASACVLIQSTLQFLAHDGDASLSHEIATRYARVFRKIARDIKAKQMS